MGTCTRVFSVMTLIQIFLITLCVALLLLYFSRFRSLLLDRVAAVLLCGGAIIMVIAPELSTRIANFVGVGRGVDLVMYLSITAGTFIFLLAWSKLNTIQRVQTEIIRELAIRDVRNRPRGSSCGELE